MSGEGEEGPSSPGKEQQDVTHPMKAFSSELSKLQSQVQALQSTKLQEQVSKLRESVKSINERVQAAAQQSFAEGGASGLGEN